LRPARPDVVRASLLLSSLSFADAIPGDARSPLERFPLIISSKTKNANEKIKMFHVKRRVPRFPSADAAL
jgi:hypothetical protein